MPFRALKQVAITHARSRLLEDASKPALSALSPPDADLQSRYQTQLRQMQLVPTSGDCYPDFAYGEIWNYGVGLFRTFLALAGFGGYGIPLM